MQKMTDIYLIKNSDGGITSILEVPEDFDIMQLSNFTIEEALIYLSKNNIPASFRGGVKGTLNFKK